MPELPDITVYVERIAAHAQGAPLTGLRLASPFVLRTVDPPVAELVGRTLTSVGRLGKRIVLAFEGDRFAVIHLMIAGRLRWSPRQGPVPAAIPRKVGLAAFDFPTGSMIFTEASPKKRASLHLVRGADGLAAFDRGGLDTLAASPAQFAARLRSERHTIKRALTDPTVLDGIGNAYSDEILHRARMSPFRLTTALDDAEVAALHAATVATLTWWTTHLRAEVGAGFPDKVTAFRPEMAVHGKYGQPCPACGDPVQRIVYAANEANYCATCQTGGKLLADRSLSRLLHDDWPRTLEELEERRRGAPATPAPPPASSEGGPATAEAPAAPARRPPRPPSRPAARSPSPATPRSRTRATAPGPGRASPPGPDTTSRPRLGLGRKKSGPR